MYRKAGGQPAFDALVAMEGKFTFRPDVDEEPNVELVMVYLNSSNGHTFGTCPVGPRLLSRETMEAFRHFLNSAEKDFVDVVFGGQGTAGDYHPASSRGKAESGEGLPNDVPVVLPKGLGEGR